MVRKTVGMGIAELLRKAREQEQKPVRAVFAVEVDGREHESVVWIANPTSTELDEIMLPVHRAKLTAGLKPAAQAKPEGDAKTEQGGEAIEGAGLDSAWGAAARAMIHYCVYADEECSDRIFPSIESVDVPLMVIRSFVDLLLKTINRARVSMAPEQAVLAKKSESTAPSGSPSD